MSASNTEGPAQWHAALARQPGYVGALAGVALFVVLLLATSDAQHEFVATATVRQDTSSLKRGAPTAVPLIKAATVRNDVVSDARLADAIDALELDVLPGDPNQRQLRLAMLLDHVRRHLQVTDVSPPGASAVEVAIRLSTDSPQSSAALVNHLARSFADRYTERLTQLQRIDSVDLLAERAQARQDLRTSEAKLKELQELLREIETSQPAAVKQERAMPADAPVNPGWLELKNEHDALQARLTRLLDSMTEQHPEVANTRRDMASAKAALDRTPRHLPTEDEFAPIEETPAPSAEQARQQRLRESLEQRVAEAKIERNKAAEVYQALVEREVEEPAAEVDIAALSPQVHEAYQVDAVHRRQNGGRLAVVLSILVACSAGITLGLAANQAHSTFANSYHVESELGLPIIGRVATPHVTAETQRRRRLRNFVGRTRVICELIVFLAIGWLLLLMIADTSFAGFIVRNPIEGIVQGFARLMP